MKKVITYGTYDLLHYGHVLLLERAKKLGDYLIVGVTADDYDKTRGKINVRQSLMERIEAVKATGIADEVIVEEYEGQKIDDIKRYGVDIFTVGSDWVGKFDYLNEFCQVVYLPRTEGISSSDIRSNDRKISIGIVGESKVWKKFFQESKYVNGCEVVGICSSDDLIYDEDFEFSIVTNNYDELLENVDAVYVLSHPSKHFDHIKKALLKRKHVICESPIAMSSSQCEELFSLADEQECILMDAIKTAYSTAYTRLLLLLKGGKIGKIVSVDATCTSLNKIKVDDLNYMNSTWNSICAWGPTAMLPIFQILGTEYKHNHIISAFADDKKTFDVFTQINFIYENAVASIKVGKGIKSEGQLIISGTEGYIYVPAPWWKTDYFEVRFENQNDTRKFFYQLDGEGIRYEIVAFLNAINKGHVNNRISKELSQEICHMIEEFNDKNIDEVI